MKRYTFNSTRFWIFLPTSIFCICFLPDKFDFILIEFHGVLRFIFFAILMLISIGFSWILATNRISVSMSDSNIRIDKLRGLLPYKTKNFLFTDIKEYSFIPDRQFDTLKIKLKNGKLIRILKFESLVCSKSGDFHNFVNGFKKRIDKLNEENKTEIYRILNLYETKQGIYIAYLFGFLMLILGLFMILNPNKANIPGMLVAIVGGNFYIFQVINFRRKK